MKQMRAVFAYPFALLKVLLDASKAVSLTSVWLIIEISKSFAASLSDMDRTFRALMTPALWKTQPRSTVRMAYCHPEGENKPPFEVL